MSSALHLLDGRRQRKHLLVLLGVVLLVVTQLLGYQLWSGYQQDIAEAETKTRNYASIFEARLDATLRRTDAVLEMLVQTLPVAALNPQAVPQYAAQIDAALDLHLLNFDELGGLRVADANGDVIYTSASATTKRASLADRSYFRRLRDNPQAGLIFAEVLTSRFTGRQSVVAVRALLDKQGVFRGIVFAATELAHFEKLFQSLDVGAQGLLAIRRSDDFSLVVRWPRRDSEINQSLPENNPTRSAITAGHTAVTLEFAAKTDGVVRIFSIRKLEKYPFYVLAGLSREDALAGWHTRALAIGLSGMLLLSLLAALLFRLWRMEARESNAFIALENSEARARSVTESARDAIVTVNVAGNVVDWNPAAERLFGYTAAEVSGRPLTLIVPQRFQDAAMDGIQLLMHGDPRQIDGTTGKLTAQRKDGSEFPVERSVALWETAEGKFFTSVLRDITEHQRAEAALRQAEAILRTTLDATDEGILLIAHDGRVLSINQRFGEIWQVPEALLASRDGGAMLAHAVAQVVDPGGLVAEVKRLYDSREDARGILNFRDGRTISRLSRSLLVDGQYGRIWCFKDITAEFQAQNALRESEEVFRHLFEDMGDPILLIGDGYFVDCNAATLKLLRYVSKQEFLNCSPADVSPPRQPDGRASDEKAAEMIATALASGYHRFEWMHRRADGSDVPIEVTLTPITLDGKVILHTLWRDISERLIAEARLRLLASVFEHSGEAIVISDRNNDIIEVNKTFSQLTGYEADDVRGCNPRLLSSGRSSPEDYQAMWQGINEQGHWQGEVWDRRKDGSCYPKWLTISTVKNAAREIDYYIGSFIDISEQKAATEQINHLALHDTLTGLPNRHHLHGRLDQALAAARREGARVALMFLDMDRFKNVNDTLGHHVGDGLLQEVASRLLSCVRDSDVVARLGGDEFVVVLTGVDVVTAGSVASKVLGALARPYLVDGHELRSTSSIGIALFPEDGDNVQLLMQNADTAMYHAKSAGRDNVQFFTGGMNAELRERQALEARLHQALPRQELLLHYQPQVDGEGRVIGAEALLRWQHSELGLISPLRFIPVAEESGLILLIGRWVLEQACALLKVWAGDVRTRDLKLAVNVSPRQFRQADFVAQVSAVVLASGANPLCLKLELTESLVLDNVEDTIAKMHGIRQLGIGFSMDDFGTGYSSLAYLTRLPLDQLKIDRSFVSQLPEKKSDAVVAQTIINMGLSLGLNVIAEGVESEAQRDFLERNGCHAYQGFLFSRPLPLAEFDLYLQSNLQRNLH